MATKTTQTIIRASKEDVFNILKAQAPGLFGGKTWTDVEYFGEKFTDPTFFELLFKEE